MIHLLLPLLVLIMLLIYVGYDIWCISRFTYTPQKEKDQISSMRNPSPIRRILENWFDAILTKKLLKRLESLDRRDWLWYDNQFNNWGFPVEFYDLIPRWWNSSKVRKGRRFELIWPVCERIQNEFSRKDQLRFHNVGERRMSEAEFDYWYSITKINDEAVRIYYHRYYEVRKLKWWEDETFEKLKSIGLVNDPPSDEKSVAANEEQTGTIENK